MKQTMTQLLVLSGALSLATSCHTAKQTTTPNKINSPAFSQDMDNQYLILSDAEKEIIANNNKFALQLFKKTAGLGSTVISPVSVSYLMAMLANGADGQTCAGIMATLQLKERDLDECNALYHMMIERAMNEDKACSLNIANYFAVNKNISLNDRYVKNMQSTYHAGISRLDFSSAKCADTINKWCNEQTRGMIPSIISAVDPNAMAYIMNAIYFNGTWTNTFDKRNTKDEAFRGYTRNISRVPMMHQTETLPYWSTDSYSAVSIPYGSGNFSMTVFLPNEGKSVDDMLKQFGNTNMAALTEQSEDCIVDLKLPRFTTSTEAQLNDVISALGAASIFTPNADFSKMSDTGMFVSKLFQKAKIDVSEEGTKAAAVTAAIMTMSAMPSEQPRQVAFHANRPFVYIISERHTGAVLFMGQYTGD